MNYLLFLLILSALNSPIHGSSWYDYLTGKRNIQDLQPPEPPGETLADRQARLVADLAARFPKDKIISAIQEGDFDLVEALLESDGISTSYELLYDYLTLLVAFGEEAPLMRILQVIREKMAILPLRQQLQPHEANNLIIALASPRLPSTYLAELMDELGVIQERTVFDHLVRLSFAYHLPSFIEYFSYYLSINVKVCRSTVKDLVRQSDAFKVDQFNLTMAKFILAITDSQLDAKTILEQKLLINLDSEIIMDGLEYILQATRYMERKAFEGRRSTVPLEVISHYAQYYDDDFSICFDKGLINVIELRNDNGEDIPKQYLSKLKGTASPAVLAFLLRKNPHLREPFFVDAVDRVIIRAVKQVVALQYFPIEPCQSMGNPLRLVFSKDTFNKDANLKASNRERRLGISAILAALFRTPSSTFAPVMTLKSHLTVEGLNTRLRDVCGPDLEPSVMFFQSKNRKDCHLLRDDESEEFDDSGEDEAFVGEESCISEDDEAASEFIIEGAKKEDAKPPTAPQLPISMKSVGEELLLKAPDDMLLQAVVYGEGDVLKNALNSDYAQPTIESYVIYLRFAAMNEDHNALALLIDELDPALTHRPRFLQELQREDQRRLVTALLIHRPVKRHLRRLLKIFDKTTREFLSIYLHTALSMSPIYLVKAVDALDYVLPLEVGEELEGYYGRMGVERTFPVSLLLGLLYKHVKESPGQSTSLEAYKQHIDDIIKLYDKSLKAHVGDLLTGINQILIETDLLSRVEEGKLWAKQELEYLFTLQKAFDPDSSVKVERGLVALLEGMLLVNAPFPRACFQAVEKSPHLGVLAFFFKKGDITYRGTVNEEKTAQLEDIKKREYLFNVLTGLDKSLKGMANVTPCTRPAPEGVYQALNIAIPEPDEALNQVIRKEELLTIAAQTLGMVSSRNSTIYYGEPSIKLSLSELLNEDLTLICGQEGIPYIRFHSASEEHGEYQVWHSTEVYEGHKSEDYNVKIVDEDFEKEPDQIMERLEAEFLESKKRSIGRPRRHNNTATNINIHQDTNQGQVKTTIRVARKFKPY